MGTLYIVATPIGNLEDITIRAIKTLLEIPVIACEDTRRTGLLIMLIKDKYFKYLSPIPSPNLGEGNLPAGKAGERGEVKKKFISVRDFNEAKQIDTILSELNSNDVALVSDAGTPLISDPGYKIVRAARKAGFKVVPIPGPNAAIAALSAAGLPTNRFKFLGFLGKHWEIEPEETTIIYESPKRTQKTLEEINSRYPGAEIVVARELTKIHEEIFDYENPTSSEDFVRGRGEVTILVYLAGSKDS